MAGSSSSRCARSSSSARPCLRGLPTSRLERSESGSTAAPLSGMPRPLGRRCGHAPPLPAATRSSSSREHADSKPRLSPRMLPAWSETSTGWTRTRSTPTPSKAPTGTCFLPARSFSFARRQGMTPTKSSASSSGPARETTPEPPRYGKERRRSRSTSASCSATLPTSTLPNSRSSAAGTQHSRRCRQWRVSSARPPVDLGLRTARHSPSVGRVSASHCHAVSRWK